MIKQEDMAADMQQGPELKTTGSDPWPLEHIGMVCISLSLQSHSNSMYHSEIIMEPANSKNDPRSSKGIGGTPAKLKADEDDSKRGHGPPLHNTQYNQRDQVLTVI